MSLHVLPNLGRDQPLELRLKPFSEIALFRKLPKIKIQGGFRKEATSLNHISKYFFEIVFRPLLSATWNSRIWQSVVAYEAEST